MKKIRKITSFVLVAALIVCMFPYQNNVAAVDETIGIYTLPTLSSEYDTESMPVFIESGIYYFDIRDIAKMTRSTVSEASGVLTIKQGTRKITVDLQKKELAEIGALSSVECMKYENIVLVQAVPMLVYLGAQCYFEKEKFCCIMPEITVWEAYFEDYDDYSVDFYELFGESETEVSLVLDLLIEIIFGGKGLFVSDNSLAEDAVYEALRIDSLNYESGKQSACAQNVKLDDFIRTKSSIDFITADVGLGLSAINLDNEFVAKILDAKKMKLTNAKSIAAFSKDSAKVRKLSKEIGNVIDETEKINTSTKIVDTLDYSLKILTLASTIANTANDRIQIADDSKNLLNAVFGEEALKRLDMQADSIVYHEAIDKVSEDLMSDDIVFDTAWEKSKEAIRDELVDKGLEFVLKQLTSKAGIYLFCYNFAVFITSLLYKKTIDAYGADLRAFVGSTVQTTSSMFITSAVSKVTTSQARDPELINTMKESMLFYTRVSIALNENLIKSIDEFGYSSSKQAWIDLFMKKNDLLAAKLYALTNCTIIPAIDISTIADDVLAGKYVPDDSKKTTVDIVTVRQDAYFNSETMACNRFSAYDETYLYFKDTNGVLVRVDRKTRENRTELYSDTFFTICAIDDTFIYLLKSNNAEYDYNIVRIRKDGSSNDVIVNNISNLLYFDMSYIYYVSKATPNSIDRINRNSLSKETFAGFGYAVQLMFEQDNGFIVVTLEENSFSFFFGAANYYYLINKTGQIITDFGSSIEKEAYPYTKYNGFIQAIRYISSGYLRSTASEVYWVSADRSRYILTEQVSGWNFDKDAGIITTQNNDTSSEIAGTKPLKMILYTASQGLPTNMAEVQSNQAFFTLCRNAGGEWFYFDQSETELALHCLSADFGSNTVIKTFNLSDMRVSLEQCGVEVIDDTIYFFTINDSINANALYRYDMY